MVRENVRTEIVCTRSLVGRFSRNLPGAKNLSSSPAEDRSNESTRQMLNRHCVSDTIIQPVDSGLFQPIDKYRFGQTEVQDA